MPIPPGFEVRVHRVARDIPYEVNVNLPSIKGPEERGKPRTTGPVLDLVVPEGDDRHTILGKFLDEWSKLEGLLTILLSLLIKTDIPAAQRIMLTLGAKQIIDLFNGLGSLRLDERTSPTLINLMERLGRLNSKRNVLVHGHWVLEALIFARSGEAYLRSHFLRESTPPDQKIADLVAQPRNQKERCKYAFTLKRIERASSDAAGLAKSVAEFVEVLRNLPDRQTSH